MLQDLRFAVRSLRANPGFTVVALAVLTLGIGATTAIFSVVDAVALRGLPFPRYDRLMLVEETNPTSKGLPGGYVNAANFFEWRDQQRSFEGLAAFQGTGLTVVRDGAPESLRAMMVSSNLTALLGVSPRLGRMFTADHEVEGRQRVAVISHAFWQRWFGGAPDVIGRTLSVGIPGAAPGRNDGVWEVIGVMPDGFEFPVGRLKPIELWVPYLPRPDEYPRGDGSNRNYNAQVLGRLKDGVTRAQAYDDMARITAGLKAAYPKWFRDRWVGVTPLHETLVGKARGWMFLLLGAVGFVLLIACVNVANLVLARSTTRLREVTVRTALGATRWQLLRGLLVDHLLLTLTGAALGVLTALWGVQVLKAALPTTLPRLNDIAIDLRVLLAAIGAAVATGVAFALLPARQFANANLAGVLREGGRSGQAGGVRHRLRSALLVTEVAMAVVLLIGAGLFISSFVSLVRVDIGIDTGHVLTVGVYPPVDFNADKAGRDRDMARAATLLWQVLDRARAMPGVQAAAVASGTTPLSGGFSRGSLTRPGRPRSEDPDDSPDQKTITPGYFQTTRIPLLAGREFTDADSADGAEPVVIINDVAADRFFKNDNPIGATVDSNGTRRIVGVVKAVRLGGPEAPLRPEVYTPLSRGRAFGGTLYLRTAGDPGALAGDARRLVREMLPTVIVPEAETFRAAYEKLLLPKKFNMIVLALFGALAIVMAGAGVYGVMAYLVEQRTAEIGVRMALGAQPGAVLRMVLGGAMSLLAAGVAIGLAVGWALARSVSAFLFGVDPRAWPVYVATSGLLVVAGLAAAAIPARRAARVNPISVLR